MTSNYKRKAHHLLRLGASTGQALGKSKIFCVGRNKTGTTSVKKAFRELGLPVGEQYLAEGLIHEWAQRDFRKLFRYCHTAQAFQDVPFSWAFTFQALDQRFSGSKFILTVRDTPEEWYQSMINFQTALFGNGSNLTLDDLKAAKYIYPGWAYEVNRLVANTPESDPFNKEIFIASYIAHNNAVKEYFRHRPRDLLVLNVAETGAYNKLCDFLGKPRVNKEFPWENKTKKPN